MRNLLFAIPAAMLLAAPATSGSTNALTEKQQAKLDMRLEGRTEGKTRSCIASNDQREMTVISDDILIFGSSRNARTIYVNKPYGGCRNADRNILSYRRPTSSLCKGAVVSLVDSGTGMTMDSCSFGEFVAYTKDAD
ncbi:hypothetical protein [Parasphingorhabdus sp.]|uniref:hypothetical protein n=1 Tax=Parasphingorhabdus sp. TaxID=2709688 RepID=UPI003C73013F